MPVPEPWQELPAGFVSKEFEFGRDPARNFVELSKGSSSDPPEKKIVNISDTSVWTGDIYLAFSISRGNKGGMVIHAAAPLAPEFLAKPGVARAILEIATERHRAEPSTYKSAHFMEERGYEGGYAAFETEAKNMGLELSLGNEDLPRPRLGFAKTSRKDKLREKVDPLCLFIDSQEGLAPIRKRQKPRQPAQRSGKGRNITPTTPKGLTPDEQDLEDEDEPLAQGMVGGEIPIFAPYEIRPPSMTDTTIQELTSMFSLEASNPPIAIPVQQPTVTRLDCWKFAPLASPIVPTILPLLQSINVVITGYVDL